MLLRGKGEGKGMGKGKGEGKGQRGEREVDLSGRRYDDTQLALWCERWERQVGTAPLGLVSLNLSNNALGSASATTLAKSLSELGAPVRVIKLFSNRIGDPGAHSLAKYVEESKHALAELHLSHNAIGREGAEALLTAAVSAGDRMGGPRYPSFETVGQCRPVPFWLRLEYNIIEEGQQFQVDMEKRLLAVRRSRGYLADSGPPVPMICEAVEGFGCSSRGCSLLCPGGLGGTAAGPVVHAAHLRKQRRPGDLPGGLVARAGARPLMALPAPGDEPPAGALKPPALLPRARSPVRFFMGDEEEAERKPEAAEKVPLPVKQCRFVDVRLGEGEKRGGGLGPGAGAAAREATPEPPQPLGAVPPKAAPEVGQALRVTRQVTADDAIKNGFQPDTYLQPLQPGDEVLALHVCEGAEAGWIWAQRSRQGQGQGTGGWLALDALAAKGGA